MRVFNVYPTTQDLIDHARSVVPRQLTPCERKRFFLPVKETSDTHAHDLSDVWALARGGQIYDNWMATLEADEPKQTHPA